MKLWFELSMPLFLISRMAEGPSPAFDCPAHFQGGSQILAWRTFKQAGGGSATNVSAAWPWDRSLAFLVLGFSMSNLLFLIFYPWPPTLAQMSDAILPLTCHSVRGVPYPGASQKEKRGPVAIIP